MNNLAQEIHQMLTEEIERCAIELDQLISNGQATEFNKGRLDQLVCLARFIQWDVRRTIQEHIDLDLSVTDE